MPDETDVYIAEIVKPIDGADRSGTRLASSVYDKIKELRQPARPGGEPNWRKLREYCTQVLSKQSKDLAIAVELADAMARDESWEGIQGGIRVIIALSTEYWADLYPRIAGDDLVARANWFEQLEKRLTDVVSTSFMTSCRGDAEFQVWHFAHFRRQIEALTAESKGGKPMDQYEKKAREEALQEARDDSAQLAKAVKQSERSFYETIHPQIAQCLVLAEELKSCVGERFAAEPTFVASDPPATFKDLRKQLAEAVSIVEQILEEKPPELKREASPSGDGKSGPQGETGALTGRRPESRAQALRQLKLIAEFFQDTEPHSPVSYLAQRAAKWGEMSLETWLQEVVKEESTLNKLRETLGIPKPSD